MAASVRKGIGAISAPRCETKLSLQNAKGADNSTLSPKRRRFPAARSKSSERPSRYETIDFVRRFRLVDLEDSDDLRAVAAEVARDLAEASSDSR